MISALGRPVSRAEARIIGAKLGVDWQSISVDRFRHGLEAEYKDMLRWHVPTNSVRDYPVLLAKIVWARLKQRPDFYDVTNCIYDELDPGG